MPPIPITRESKEVNEDFPFACEIFQLNDSPFGEKQLEEIDAICVSERAQYVVFEDTTAKNEFGKAIMIFFPIPKADEDPDILEALDARNVVVNIIATNPDLELRDSGFYNSEKHDIYGIIPLLRFALEGDSIPRTMRWRKHLKETLGIDVYPHSR